ncbi:MAG: hypothetical protein ABI862_08940 [Ilumatobacteraceae bacterium]
MVLPEDVAVAVEQDDRLAESVTTAPPNLTRVTVDGSTGVNDWLKVTIDVSNPNVLSWTKVPFLA